MQLGVTEYFIGYSQVVKAVVDAAGDSRRVGIRLSPYAKQFNDCREPDVDSMIALTSHLLEQLDKLNLAYVHIVTSRAEGRFLKFQGLKTAAVGCHPLLKIQ